MAKRLDQEEELKKVILKKNTSKNIIQRAIADA